MPFVVEGCVSYTAFYSSSQWRKSTSHHNLSQANPQRQTPEKCYHLCVTGLSTRSMTRFTYRGFLPFTTLNLRPQVGQAGTK